jgi:hypothetical protein
MAAPCKKHLTKRNQAATDHAASGVLYMAFELGWTNGSWPS